VEKNLTESSSKGFKKGFFMKKVRCPDCNERFEIEMQDFDEGDLINCPECNLELIIEVMEGKSNLRIAKEKVMDETDFDEFYEE